LIEVKADPELVKIPVLVISMLGDENKGCSLGPSEHPQKPIDRTQIQNHLMPKKNTNEIAALVVGDETGTQKMLRKILKDYGLNVDRGGNGQIALDEVKKQSPRVIFLDMMMPVMDALKFLEELIKSPEGRAILIMVNISKESTHADRLLLKGGIEKLIEKKSHDQNGFLKEVRDMLESCPS
jgi:CheY-like chemotaxis protein